MSAPTDPPTDPPAPGETVRGATTGTVTWNPATGPDDPTGSTAPNGPATADTPDPGEPGAAGWTTAGPPTTDPDATTGPAGGSSGGPAGGEGEGWSRRGLLTPGGEWGRWTLRRRIRSGGSAQVWRATDADGERSAMKFLLQPDSEVEAKRFRRERDLGERLQGKWLPKVLDSDLGDFIPWIAFEYLDFPAVDQLVGASGPLTGEALVIFTRDLWDAVLSLHQNGIAHRDLSARNVLIDVDDGRLRLIDLGSGTTGDGTLITQDVFPASLGFAAPEQFEVRESRVGPAADLWSWAAVVHYAATGRTVFPIEPRMAYFELVRARTTPDLSGVPAAIRPALAAALRFEPEARHADEINAALPLRSHEADLHAAESRLADADAEIRALRAAVAEANQKLANHDADAPRRIEALRAQAEQAAADAAEARRQLEATAMATRQTTGASARVTELHDALTEAERQRDHAVAASGMQVRDLQARLRQADAELVRLRAHPPAAAPAPPPGPAVAHPAPAPRYASRPAVPRPAAPPAGADRPRPSPVSQPVRATVGPGLRRRRGPGRVVSLLGFGAVLVVVFLAVAAHPVFDQARWTSPEQSVLRFLGGVVVATVTGALGITAALSTRIVSLGRFRPSVLASTAASAAVVLALAFLTPPDLPRQTLDRAIASVRQTYTRTDPSHVAPPRTLPTRSLRPSGYR